eukprot:449207-Pelagomonas_calceolata.AAC.4
MRSFPCTACPPLPPDMQTSLASSIESHVSVPVQQVTACLPNALVLIAMGNLRYQEKKENYVGRGNSPCIKKRKEKNRVDRDNSPYINYGKGDTLAQRTVSPFYHEATKQKVLMGIWRVTRSTWPKNLAVKSYIVSNSTPSGNKLVGIHKRMGMKSVSKVNGTLVVKSHQMDSIMEKTEGDADQSKATCIKARSHAHM